MHHLTLAELAKNLRAKEFSVTELTKTLLARIEASQPGLNAFITVMSDSALSQAAAADRGCSFALLKRAGLLSACPGQRG